MDHPITCIVCNSTETNRLYKSLIKCSKCGFAWADLDISKNQILDIYDSSYFEGGEYISYVNEKKALQKNFERNIKILSTFKPNGKLLEIGCAYGFFLDKARNQYDVSGIDINENACKYAKEQLKLKVICGDFLETEFKEEYYDVIVAWATLEHLKNPHLYIEKISKLLKKGGIFACSTPDIESFTARIRKEKWRQIHPPTHLSYFSSKSLSFLLNKHGFDIIKQVRLGEYRSIDNLLYGILVIRHKLINIYSLLKRYHLNDYYIYLNLFDTIYTFALKKT